jgi:hypothetical protein
VCQYRSMKKKSNKKLIGALVALCCYSDVNAKIISGDIELDNKVLKQAFTLEQNVESYEEAVKLSAREASLFISEGLYHEAVIDVNGDMLSKDMLAKNLYLKVRKKEKISTGWRLEVLVRQTTPSIEPAFTDVHKKRLRVSEWLKREDGSERTLSQYIAEEKDNVKSDAEVYRMAKLMYFDYIKRIKEYISITKVNGLFNAYVDENNEEKNIDEKKDLFKVDTKPVAKMVDYIKEKIKGAKPHYTSQTVFSPNDKEFKIKFLNQSKFKNDPLYWDFVWFLYSSSAGFVVLNNEQRLHYDLVGWGYDWGFSTESHIGPIGVSLEHKCVFDLAKQDNGINLDKARDIVFKNNGSRFSLYKPKVSVPIKIQATRKNPRQISSAFHRSSYDLNRALNRMERNYVSNLPSGTSRKKKREAGFKLRESLSNIEMPSSCLMEHVGIAYRNFLPKKIEEKNPWITKTMHWKLTQYPVKDVSTDTRLLKEDYIYTREASIDNKGEFNLVEELSHRVSPGYVSLTERDDGEIKKLDVLLGLLEGNSEAYTDGVRSVVNYRFSNKPEKILYLQ